METQREWNAYGFLFAAANEFLRYGLDPHLSQQLTRDWSLAVGAHWNENELQVRSLIPFIRGISNHSFEQQAGTV